MASSRPGDIEQRLRNLGIELPTPPQPFGAYVEPVQSGRLLFLGGMLPVVDHKPKCIGRLGQELDIESGRDALRTASMNALAASRAHCGTLDKVTRVVRLGIYLATPATSSISRRSPMPRPSCSKASLGRRSHRFAWCSAVASLPLGVSLDLELILEVTE